MPYSENVPEDLVRRKETIKIGSALKTHLLRHQPPHVPRFGCENGGVEVEEVMESEEVRQNVTGLLLEEDNR